MNLLVRTTALGTRPCPAAVIPRIDKAVIIIAGTPMAELSFSSSPALDPSSRTPQPGSPLSPSSPNHPPPSTRHILLDPRLLNAQLRVNVNGGGFNNKELTVSIRSINGQLGIRRIVYKTANFVDPEWVSVKHPNPTRDNGLLIVIKGDHCGKYVRRIHHQYESGKAIVLLAVVSREAGSMDRLTGEELGLDVFHLCVCEESKEHKKLNSSLMDQLREEARKTWAR